MLKRYIFDDNYDVAFNGWQIRSSRIRSFASIYGSLGLSWHRKEGLNYSYPKVHITSRTDGMDRDGCARVDQKKRSSATATS